MSAVLLIDGVRFTVPRKHIRALRKLEWRVVDGYAVLRSTRQGMHRVIAERERWNLEGMIVDHINGDLTDNTLENLRAVTPQQSAWNRGFNRNNTSGFRGVTFDKQRGLWTAQIKVDYRKRNLGRFRTPEEASQVYEAAAKAAFGEFYRKPEHRPHKSA